MRFVTNAQLDLGAFTDGRCVVQIFNFPPRSGTPPQPWQKNIKDYEVIDIKGKGRRKVWTEFLSNFGLRVSFIGDWDNVCEVTSFDLEKYIQCYRRILIAAEATIEKKSSTDGPALFGLIEKVVANPISDNLKELRALKEHIVSRSVEYPKLMAFIKANDPDEWLRLETVIEESRDQDLFILRQGELENYLGIAKGLDHVIEFCRNRINAWLNDPTSVGYRDEIYQILATIFS